MSVDLSGAASERDLRLRALKHLMVPGSSHDNRLDAAAALGVLHQLASASSTAGAALTLLHELQVHQVELDLQDEELRRSRSELEAALARQVQLYDFAPVGYLTVDRATTVRELNLTAADMLGAERDQLLGHALDAFLEPRSTRALLAMLDCLSEGAPRKARALQLVAAHGRPQDVLISAARDPNGQYFLVTLVLTAEDETSTSDYPRP